MLAAPAHCILPLAYTVVIFVKGSAPADAGALQVNDKVAHAVVFFGLVLACAPLAVHCILRRGVQVRLAVLACAFYSAVVGAALELWQSRIPHRTADVWDWVADAVGALLAAALLLALFPLYSAWRARNLA